MLKMVDQEENAMSTAKLDSRIRLFGKAVIAQRIGDMSTLPDRLVQHAFHVYDEFIAAYLNVLRQKKDKPRDWFPESLSIDWELVDEMRHFFSDYQHITKAFLTLDKQIGELHHIDRSKQPNLYEHKVASILGQGYG
jgi:hypothetical protein